MGESQFAEANLTLPLRQLPQTTRSSPTDEHCRPCLLAAKSLGAFDKRVIVSTGQVSEAENQNGNEKD